MSVAFLGMTCHCALVTCLLTPLAETITPPFFSIIDFKFYSLSSELGSLLLPINTHTKGG